MTAPTTPLRPDQLRWLIAGLIVGLFLASTEQSVVATALPTMAGELGGANRLAWVVSAYLLSSTVVTPLYGKMSDLFGRRLVYQTGIGLFLVGSALCGAAQTMNQLVAARAFQGLGGGGLMSLAFVILGDVVSPRERGRYIGVFTAVFTFSAVTGPLWGGLLVDTVGWRWVFWSVVPLSVVALLVTNRGLRLPFATRSAPIDWAGIVLLVMASTALILVPIWGGETFAWGSAPILVTGLIGVTASVGFVVQEQYAVEPVVPLRLFRTRTVAVVFGMGFCLMASLIAVSTFMPLFLQVAKGASATRSGLLLTPQSVGISLSSTIAGILVSRSGRYKWTLLTGPLAAVAALAVLARMEPGISTVGLAPVLFLLGLGLGLTFPNMTLSVQNASPVEDLGIATSVANFFRSMGGAFGSAIAGAVLTARLSDSLGERLGPARLEELGGAEGLIRSPKVVHDLAPDLKTAAIDSVTDAVTWVITLSIPVMVVVFLLALFVVETPLRTSSTIGGSD
ncbi:MAG: MFS transporter [Actinomycetia bacterium]|nr:MFS transporter [Actinomycetes bacterium]